MGYGGQDGLELKQKNIVVWAQNPKYARAYVYALDYAIGNLAAPEMHYEIFSRQGWRSENPPRPMNLRIRDAFFNKLDRTQHMQLIRENLGLETARADEGIHSNFTGALSRRQDNRISALAQEEDRRDPLDILDADLYVPDDPDDRAPREAGALTDLQLRFMTPDTRVQVAHETEERPLEKLLKLPARAAPMVRKGRRTGIRSWIKGRWRKARAEFSQGNTGPQIDAIIVLVRLEDPDHHVLARFDNFLQQMVYEGRPKLGKQTRVVFVFDGAARSTAYLPVVYDWDEASDRIEDALRQGNVHARPVEMLDPILSLMSRQQQAFLRALSQDATGTQLDRFATQLQELKAEMRVVFCDFEGLDVGTNTIAHISTRADLGNLGSTLFSNENLQMWLKGQRQLRGLETEAEQGEFYAEFLQSAFQSWQMYNLGTSLLAALSGSDDLDGVFSSLAALELQEVGSLRAPSEVS